MPIPQRFFYIWTVTTKPKVCTNLSTLQLLIRQLSRLHHSHLLLWFFEIKPSAQSDIEFYGQWLSSKARLILLKLALLMEFIIIFFFIKMNHKKNISMLGF